MKKLALDDVRPPRLYERARDAARQRVIELKKARRIPLGPDVTLVFENRDTLTFQVEEMLRAEHLEEPRKIAAELEVYNSLIPDAGELSATLFVEIPRAEAIRPTLNRLVGIDEHVRLEIDGVAIPGEFEAGRSEDDRISAVQYLRFRIPPEAQGRLRTPGAAVALLTDHPSYRHRQELSEASRAALAADLD